MLVASNDFTFGWQVSLLELQWLFMGRCLLFLGMMALVLKLEKF